MIPNEKHDPNEPSGLSEPSLREPSLSQLSDRAAIAISVSLSLWLILLLAGHAAGGAVHLLLLAAVALLVKPRLLERRAGQDG